MTGSSSGFVYMYPSKRHYFVRMCDIVRITYRRSVYIRTYDQPIIDIVFLHIGNEHDVSMWASDLFSPTFIPNERFSVTFFGLCNLKSVDLLKKSQDVETINLAMELLKKELNL